MTRFSRSVFYYLKKQAIKRRYDPKITPVIYNVFVENTHKNKRPSISLEKQLEIVSQVIKDQYRREKSTVEIAAKIEVSQSLITQILKKQGYKKVKST